MTGANPDFEAVKAITRLQWMLHFEAVASVGNDEDALSWMPAAPGMQ
jgi:hypothetical protein